MNTVDYKAIGKRVRLARKDAKLTQEKLVEITDMSLSHISNIETGSTKVSLPTLIKIVNTLDVSLDTVCCDSLTHIRPELTGQIVKLLNQMPEAELRFLLNVTIAITDILETRLDELHPKDG